MKRVLVVSSGLVILLAIAVAIAGAFMYRRVQEPFKGYAAAEQFVEIPQGSSAPGIGQRLVAAGIVRDETSFRIALWLSNRSRQLKAGEYRFDRPMTPYEAIDKIARGDVYLRTITFPEGLTIDEMARLFESQGFGPASAFRAAAASPAPIADLDAEAKNLEGYLFPETYKLPRSATAGDLVTAMVRGFREVFTPRLVEQARARQLTVRQAVTLASIVEKETAKADERPMVAAVYANRLKIGMGLQSDPTVIYALQQAKQYEGNLTRDNLTYDSPYNTYRYAGLPPGPIAAPGRGSLEAAVQPASVDYLYFVSKNDGSHVFAATLDEHNRNVYKYQVQYFREQRAKGN